MRSHRVLGGLFLLSVLGGFGAVAACGSRTGLDVQPTSARPQAGRADAGMDGFISFDVSFPDTFDALPPIDVTPLPDVFINDCPDAGSTLVYVVTSQNELFSFYPPTAAFKRIGLLQCPAPPGFNPFSMAVDRKGTAYVLYSDQMTGAIFRVSTLTAACVATSYVTGQSGFQTFGMGFSGNPNGMTETLYVASDNLGPSGTLAAIDTTTFRLSPIGVFQPQQVSQAELTGTGDGRLFTFYSVGVMSPNSSVAQIDPTNAQVTANNDLNGFRQGNGWAFAFWGGAFYLFTAPAPPVSRVTRYDPANGSLTLVATLPTTIVGAGVSTCAPQQ